MADKIVSWGGFDSKGTDGMGITGSLNVSGSGNFTDGLVSTGSLNFALSGLSTTLTNPLKIQGGGGVVRFDATNTEYRAYSFNLKINSSFDGTGQSALYSSYTYGGASPRIGIGTTTPTSRLQVKGSGTTSATTAFRVENANASGSMVVLDNGNVGIGKNTPISTLHLGNDTSGFLGDFTTPVITFNTLNNGIYLDSNRIFFKAGGALSFAGDSNGPLGNGFRINADLFNDLTTPIFVPSRLSNGATSGYGGNTAGNLSIITNNTPRIYVDFSGSVGIGTTSPTEKLEVTGNIKLSSVGTGNSASSYGLLFYGTTSSGTQTDQAKIQSSPWSTNTNGGNLQFYTSNASNVITERVRINGDGNVGIGTTSPTSRLQVKGSGTTDATTAFRVENANASGSMVVLDDGNVGIGTNAPETKLTIQTDNIGITQNDTTGFILQNTTPATSISGSQYSPALLFASNGWKQNSPAASEKGTWRIHSLSYTSPSSAGQRINSNLDIDWKVNNETYTNILRIDKACTITSGLGIIKFNSAVNFSQNVNLLDSFRYYGWFAGSANGGRTAFEFGSTVLASQNTANGSVILNRVSFSPTTGSTTFVTYEYSGTINQTGGANGITRGIYINPTLTSAADFRAIETVVGNNLLNSTSGNTYIGLSTNTGTARLQVQGSGTTSATTAFRVENANASSSMVVLDNGNVGIGTASPTNPLSVNGSANIAGSLTTAGIISNSSNNPKISFTDTDTSADSRNWIIGPDQQTFVIRASTEGSYTSGGNALEIYQTGSLIQSVSFPSGSIGIGTTTPSYKLDVSGSGNFTNNLTVTGSTQIYKSGSTVLDVQGSQGQLFSVVDELSGSLMSVNDISGLPILEVFSDDKVVMGTYGAPGLTVSGSNATVATGSSAPTGTAEEGTFKFAVVGGSYYIYAYLGGAWRSGSLA